MTLRDATEDETLGNSWELVGTQGTHPPIPTSSYQF
jgi:hypothetical protein